LQTLDGDKEESDDQGTSVRHV